MKSLTTYRAEALVQLLLTRAESIHKGGLRLDSHVGQDHVQYIDQGETCIFALSAAVQPIQ
jgi:hypothetical protein